MRKTSSTAAFIIAAFVFVFANASCGNSDDSYIENKSQSTNISANSQTNPTNSATSNSTQAVNSSAPSNASNR